MPTSFFITATNTDSGKTYVTSQLLRFLRAQHQHCEAIKPVASGCIEQEGQLISEDARILSQGSSQSLEQINPWRFKLPVSPHIAAEAAGVRLTAREIADYCVHSQFEDLDYLLIEGAGGLLVPLNEQETWVDVINQANLEVILVVGIQLGCINHALLSAAYLEHQKIPCRGWVANFLDPNCLEQNKILETLTSRMNLPLLGQVPFQGEFKLSAGTSLLGRE